jgi:hypothetical protein
MDAKAFSKKEVVLPSVDEVKNAMSATGQFNEDLLNALSQEEIDYALANSKPLPEGFWPDDAKPLGTNWTGNNFLIVDGLWYWDDQPGSPCGRTRTWHYKPTSGASYREVGKCPQGYPWFEIFVPS